MSGAKPDSATQDTTLDVTISGSGFIAGSAATWSFGGFADATQVRTNSTRFINSRQLIANITISANATIGKWDVIVTAGTKGGIGTEAFAIKTRQNVDNNSRANYVIANSVNVAVPTALPDWRPAGLQGDGRLRDGASANGSDSEYQGEFCGANGVIFNGFVSFSSNSGDLNMAPDGRHGGYCGDARYVNIYFNGPAAAPTRVPTATRLFAVWQMLVGQVLTKPATFHVHVASIPNCDDVVFDGAYPPSQGLLVTRLPDLVTSGGSVRRWRLNSQGNHMGTCVVAVSLNKKVAAASYFLPLSILVTEVRYPAPHYP